jgi:hypothetical protein
MIRARADSLTPEVLTVISARVSRNVLALRVHAGPTSCRMLAMPIDESEPSEGETLFAIPGARGPKDSPILFGSIVEISCCGLLSVPTSVVV